MNLEPLHILAPVFDKLTWLQLDYDARAERIGDRFRVTYRVVVDDRECAATAEHHDACKAYSQARYMAAGSALRDLPEHRVAELRSLGYEPVWHCPDWLRSEMSI